jgi:hypothetical protein
MSELMGPEDSAGVPGEHERIAGPASVRREAAYFDARAEADVRAEVAARDHHEGLTAKVAESGEELHGMLERLRHDETPERDELRPLAGALDRHYKAMEATARRALEERDAAGEAVQDNRADGESLRRDLADLITRRQSRDTYSLSVAGLLADIDMYLAHERRDLIPAIDRELSATQSARLARAFAA